MTFTRNAKRTIELSLRFRETNLSSGAKLELIAASRSPSIIQVALDLPDSEALKALQKRHVRPFASDTTFWRIIREYEVSIGGNLNFTARGVAGITADEGKIYYETPVLNVMGRELSTFTDLQKNLAQLGYRNGSVSIKLMFRTTDRLLGEAMMEIGAYFKTFEADADIVGPSASASENVEVAEAAAINTTVSVASTELVQDEAKDTTTASTTGQSNVVPQSPAEPILAPDGRPTTVIAAPSGDTPRAALLPHNEEDLVPTVAHLKSYQARLQTKTQNTKLLSYAEEEAAQQEQMRKLDSPVPINVKINLPDQQKIIAKFNSNETGTSLYDYVRACMIVQEEKFTLSYTTPSGPYIIPLNKKLVENPAFMRNMAVNLSWVDEAFARTYTGRVLKEELASKAQAPKIEEPEGLETEVPKPAAPPSKSSGKSEDKAGGVPKWLKLKK